MVIDDAGFGWFWMVLVLGDVKGLKKSVREAQRPLRVFLVFRIVRTSCVMYHGDKKLNGSFFLQGHTPRVCLADTLQVSSFKNLYDEKCANCNLTFLRESQNAGRERFAKAPRKKPRRTASRKLS